MTERSLILTILRCVTVHVRGTRSTCNVQCQAGPCVNSVTSDAFTATKAPVVNEPLVSLAENDLDRHHAPTAHLPVTFKNVAFWVTDLINMFKKAKFSYLPVYGQLKLCCL